MAQSWLSRAITAYFDDGEMLRGFSSLLSIRPRWASFKGPSKAEEAIGVRASTGLRRCAI